MGCVVIVASPVVVSAGKAGFSLIEMLIVVLVIAVLAGIAVPSYQEWLARAENAAALADLGQMVRTETALFGDWQQFGRTNESASVAGHGGGANLIGPGTQDTVLACPSGFLVLGMSKGVHLIVNTESSTGSSFSGMAKHFQGTRIFAVDSDVGVLRQRLGSRQQSLAGAGVHIDATSDDDMLEADGWQNL